MAFADPTFLVPSREIHEHANPERHGDRWPFNFEASTKSGSRDRWVPYRVNTLDLGKKILAIMRAQARLPTATADAARILDISDVVWVRKG